MQNVFQHLKFLLDFQICFQPINKLLKNYRILKMGNAFFSREDCEYLVDFQKL